MKPIPYLPVWRRAALGLALLAPLCACERPLLRLDAGETAALTMRLEPGATQMVEIDLGKVGKPGAELSLSSGGVVMPAIWLPEGRRRDGQSGPMAAFLWSGQWPVDPTTSMVRLANFGPGELSVVAARIQRGGEDELYMRSRGLLPVSPLGWVDLKDVMMTAPTPGFDGPPVLLQLDAAKEFSIQPRRREAFKSIVGLPLPIRMASNVIPAGVEVRACRLSSGGAVVGLSRADNPYFIRHYGPGWVPSAKEARWIPMPATAGWTRGFEIKDVLYSLSICAGAPQGGPASFIAKLYRIDTVKPILTRKIERTPTEGAWIEFKFDQPEPPGDYVLELQALEGAPAWLAWNREAKPVPGSEWTELVETVVGVGVPPQIKLDTYIPVQTLVAGSAFTVEKWSGRSAEPVKGAPRTASGEIMLESRLFPGDTDLYYLRDYQIAPPPAQ